MKLSIIVPVYNTAGYLEQCVNSLLAQPIPEDDFEILLVNDGSIDQSLDVMQRFLIENPDIIEIIDTENGGQGRARNLALDVAQGDYIGFADSDDWVADDMYARLLTEAEETDADIAVCNAYSVSGSEQTVMNARPQGTDISAAGSVWARYAATAAAMTPVTDYREPEYKRTALDGKVNMVWHNIAGVAGNDTFAGRIANTQSVNVVAPTWFVVLNDTGSVEVRATQAYVNAAHEMGMKVWAVLDNFTGPDGVQQKFLASDEARSAVISKVIDTALEMGIDGINVDIEGISEKYGKDFIEFVRELSISCRGAGLVLSVDNYVPYNFNNHYRLDEQGLFADYVVIMGYDEHYAGSQEAGSVASIGYVTYGIEEALSNVPAEKLINGIPFYSRIWKTAADGVTSMAYGMNELQTFISNHNMTVEWNAATEQNYAEVSEDDATYQIWIEDAESIEKKLEVMQAHNIAGVAEWCLGMESADVWDVIADYMNK